MFTTASHFLVVIVNTVEHVTSNLSVDLAQAHGQFTNSLESLLPTKTYLDKLSSTYDFDLFILNIDSNLNPDCNFAVQQTCCQYFSPYSFSLFKNILKVNKNACFSLLHNNVKSLKRNLENLQAHSLDELDHNFSIIGVSETKITRRSSLEFNQDLPNIWVEVQFITNLILFVGSLIDSIILLNNFNPTLMKRLEYLAHIISLFTSWVS